MTVDIGTDDMFYIEYWAKNANEGSCWYGIYFNPDEASFNWQYQKNTSVQYSEDSRQMVVKLTNANGESVYVSAENKTNDVQLKISPEDKVATGLYYAAQ